MLAPCSRVAMCLLEDGAMGEAGAMGQDGGLWEFSQSMRAVGRRCQHCQLVICGLRDVVWTRPSGECVTLMLCGECLWLLAMATGSPARGAAW